MLSASEAFMAELAKPFYTPILRMRIWPDKGPRRRLKTQSDWAAINDPAVVNDNNVSASRKSGALVLAEGPDVPITGSGFTALKAHRVLYTMRVASVWHTGGNNWTGHYPVHDYWKYTVIQESTVQLLPFVSSTTFLVDTCRIVANNSGNSASAVTVRILDVNGNQVGNIGRTAIAAGSGQVTLDVTGLAATLRKGGSYKLAISCAVPAAFHMQYFTWVDSTVILDVYSYDITGYTHYVGFSDGSGFTIGGKAGYQASGQAHRTIDVGAVPTSDGSVQIKDVVPLGADPTDMQITLYYTDDSVVAAESALINWTSHGVVQSGDTVPAHRWWRAVVDMAGNVAQDETPELAELAISYIGDPIIISQQLERGLIEGYTDRYQITGWPGLNDMSTASAKMAETPDKAMTSSMSITLGDEDAVHGLYQKSLRGRPLEMLAGFANIDDALTIWSGIARDIATTSPGRHTLPARSTIELADVMIPREEAGPAWSNVTDYNISDVVVYGNNSWLSLQASGPGNGGAVTPGTNAAVWQDSGTVWLTIGYTPATNGGVAWHLAEIVKDILINRINVPGQYVNLQSVDQFISLYPNRTGERELEKPVKAKELLSDLAIMLEAQWVDRNGQLALVPEPTLSDPIRAVMDKSLIKRGATFRRGLAELANECMILTAYSGSGSGDEQFNNGVAVADAASIDEFDIAILKTLRDRWNVPEAELLIVAANTVNRWSNGRRYATCKADMIYVRLEPGDVVEYDSIDIPRGDPGPFRMMVTGKDLRWKEKHLSFALLEVR